MKWHKRHGASCSTSRTVSQRSKHRSFIRIIHRWLSPCFLLPFWHFLHKRHEYQGAAITQARVVGVHLPVREITKSSSTFSATNISSNAVWLLQLHDTIQKESIFVTKFSSIYLAKGEKRLDFRLLFVNLQRAKNGTHMFGVKYRYVSVALISSNRTLGIIPH